MSQGKKSIIKYAVLKKKVKKNIKSQHYPPVSFLKTLTSNGTSRKMIVGGAATAARVEPSDKRGDISNEAVVDGWGWCRSSDDSGSGDGGGTWGSDDNRHVVVMCLRKSYDGSVFLGTSGGRSRMSGVGTGGGGGSDGNRG